MRFADLGLVIAGILLCAPLLARAQSAPRDGSHDFDFARGSWHTHAIQVSDPFDGGAHTQVLDGTKIARPIWNGRAWLEEIEADGPSGHWEGASLFVYNPRAGQWSQTYIDGSGETDPPTIGSFSDGRGEFYGAEVYQGRTVLVRGVWSNITADAHRYEIFYSRDGGRNWVSAFRAELTRLH